MPRPASRHARRLLVGAAVTALAASASLETLARPMLGGPGLRGGFGHFGTAMSIHAPGGGAMAGHGFEPINGGMRPGAGGAGTRTAFTRPGGGGSGTHVVPPGPEPGPGPGPGPQPPGPGPRPPGPGPGPHPPGPGPGPHPPGPPPGPNWWDWDNDPFWDPIAAGVVIGATAAVTAAAIGSTTYYLPSNCATVFRGDLTYYQCGDVWYQPQYVGSGVTYVVVAPP